MILLSFYRFSAEGTPFYMDSSGIVRMCNRRFGMSWVQVANTKSHVSFIRMVKKMKIYLLYSAVISISIYKYMLSVLFTDKRKIR